MRVHGDGIRMSKSTGTLRRKGKGVSSWQGEENTEKECERECESLLLMLLVFVHKNDRGGARLLLS